MSPTPSPFHVAIIGAGLSGTLVAIHLLRRSGAGFRIALIERRPHVGRGVAYSTSSDAHLLNVPAAGMGALPGHPDHFLRWVQRHLGEPGFPQAVSGSEFLPRRLYGEYLADWFAEARAASAAEIEVIRASAIDIEELPAGGRVLLDDGRSLEAERIVLALGNLPGEYPIPRPLPLYHSTRYVHVPWAGDALENLSPDDDVLLVGQGLTATDLVLQLDRRGHRGTIHALSRNGQRPQVHQPAQPYPSFLEHEPAPTTARAMLRRFRAEIRSAASRGVDWRSVVDSVRPQAQAVWQSWSWEERARFLRYVRPYWEVHRHRVSPQTAATLAQLEQVGKLVFHAGRLQTLELGDDCVQVLYRRRGTIQHVALRVARIINCTGPRTDYSKYQHPLFIHLLARGLIDHDPLALGIHALPNGEVLRYHGGPTGWLFTLGAPLKGALWETTAVREIREQAAALAERLLAAEVASAERP